VVEAAVVASTKLVAEPFTLTMTDPLRLIV